MYLQQISEPQLRSLPSAARQQTPSVLSGQFTEREWGVIASGAIAGLRPFGWTGDAEKAAPLSRPCLHSLRRMAALAARYGWNVPACEHGAFLRAGWSEDQFELLIDSVVADFEPLIADAEAQVRVVDGSLRR